VSIEVVLPPHVENPDPDIESVPRDLLADSGRCSELVWRSTQTPSHAESPSQCNVIPTTVEVSCPAVSKKRASNDRVRSVVNSIAST
jgi:hypothetical protein